MSRTSQFTVRAADWSSDGPALRAIRTQVFIEEQQVPAALEWDSDDDRAVHVLVLAPDGTAVGTGRLLPAGRIGRMAVLKEWRGKGAGGALLARLLELAHRLQLDDVVLHAQTHAIGFYARFGFRPEGEVFMEADIPHRVMRRILINR
jgi:predicted GNAT family N-acyltransferase